MLMQALFILTAASGALYFLLVKRRFDYFALAFFSALVYFMPGFFGATSYHVGGVWTDTPIHPETYGIMTAVMASIWFSAWLSSNLPAWSMLDWSVPAPSLVSPILMLTAVGGLLGLYATAGNVVFDPDKDLVLENLGRWHILFYTAATIGLPVAFHNRQYSLAGLFIALLGVDLFLGFRSAFAISIISVLIVLLYQQGSQRLVMANKKLIFAVIGFGLFMFGYKIVAFAIKAGAWDLVWNQLQDADTYLFLFTRSEPFVVQQTLNEVVANHFETSPSHIYSSLYQLLLFAPELGAESVTFNSLFQPALFPEVEYGLAANIWAQMWSAGSWPLLITFLLIFNTVLAIGNTTLHGRSIVLKAGLAPVFCYWAFYIHRNELGYALNLEKRLLLLLLFVTVLVSIIKAATSRSPALQK